MNILYEKSFLKDIRKLKSQSLKDEITSTIDEVKKASTLQDLADIKKLKGHSSAFRIKIGNYRLGFFFENNTIIMCRCLHRRDVYRYFP